MHGGKRTQHSKTKQFLPTVKFGDGFIVLWGCANFVKVEGRMDSSEYQQILENNVQIH